MEIILDFLDNSPSKTFLIPLKSTAFNALRMIYFKFDLDVHADHLTEFYLAITDHPFHWQNVRWLEPSTNLQTVTKNGLVHVLLLKKYFLANTDIQIAKTNSFIRSLLYSQFYKTYISSLCFIDYSILIFLSARLLQCEYYGCEISINSLHSNGILSMILPRRFHEDCLIGYLIYNCWHTLRHLAEEDSKIIFISDFLSHTKLLFQYTYDVFYDFYCQLILTVDQICFSHFETTAHFEEKLLSSLTSFSSSSICRSILLKFDDKVVMIFSDFVIEIVAIISVFCNIPHVNLDYIHTDVSKATIGMESQFEMYHCFFVTGDEISNYLCTTPPHENDRAFLNETAIFTQDISMVLSPVRIISTSSDAISLYGDCHDSTYTSSSNIVSEDGVSAPRYFVDQLDTDYDILLLSNVVSAKTFPTSSSCVSVLSVTSETTCSDAISRQQIDYDYIDLEPQATVSEHINPIYSHLYVSSFDNGNEYMPCVDESNISLELKQNVIVSPISSPCINNLSNFEYLGATYTDIQELGISSRLFNGFREQTHQLVHCHSDNFETDNTNVYMHSESISRPVLLESSEPIIHSKNHVALQNFAEFSNFHFVYYILLPNTQVLQELVDIRTTPKALIFKLGEYLGLSHVLQDFTLLLIGKSLNDPFNDKLDIQQNKEFENHSQLSDFFDDSSALKLDTGFVNQTIKGSLILHLKANSLQIDKVRAIPNCNRDITYLRCSMLFLHGNIPMSLQQSVEFAALQYQVYYSSRVSNSQSLFCSPLEFMTKEYKNVRGIANQIIQEHSAIQTFSLSKAMDAMIHKFANLPQSDYIFFHAKDIKKKHILQHPKLINVYLGVSLRGLITIHPITKRILSIVEYQSIKSWKFTEEAFIYQNGHDEKIVALKTIQGYCISTLITAHIYQISNINDSNADMHTHATSPINLGKVSVAIIPEENNFYESI